MSARSAFRRPLVQANRSGSVCPAMRRIARPLTRMSLATRVSFTFASSIRRRRVISRCLRVRVSVAQLLDRGRRHEAPAAWRRSRLPVALAPRNADVLRVGEHQRERSFASRTCHTGFQYTPVASIATCVQPDLGQPGRQFEQARCRGRELPVLGRDLPTRRDARARVHAPRVDIQPDAPVNHNGLPCFTSCIATCWRVSPMGTLSTVTRFPDRCRMQSLKAKTARMPSRWPPTVLLRNLSAGA